MTVSLFSRKREREEPFDAFISQFEGISLGDSEPMIDDDVLNFDPNISLHMSDDKFALLARLHTNWTKLNVPQALRVTDFGILDVLYGRKDMQMLSFCRVPRMTDRSLETIGEHCPDIKAVSFIQCRQITDKGVKSLSEKCRKLSVINLDWCQRITDASLKAIGANCPELQEFTATDCPWITLEGFKALLAGCRKLEKIDLWGCTQVTDIWVTTLISWKAWLEDRQEPIPCKLREIDLTGCPKVSKEIIERFQKVFKGLSLASG
jgi:hypothetical protein